MSTMSIRDGSATGGRPLTRFRRPTRRRLRHLTVSSIAGILAFLFVGTSPAVAGGPYITPPAAVSVSV